MTVQALNSDMAVQSRLSRGFVNVDDTAEVVGFSGCAGMLLFSFTRMMRRS